jgi:histone H3/H4
LWLSKESKEKRKKRNGSRMAEVGVRGVVGDKLIHGPVPAGKGLFSASKKALPPLALGKNAAAPPLAISRAAATNGKSTAAAVSEEKAETVTAATLETIAAVVSTEFKDVVVSVSPPATTEPAADIKKMDEDAADEDEDEDEEEEEENQAASSSESKPLSESARKKGIIHEAHLMRIGEIKKKASTTDTLKDWIKYVRPVASILRQKEDRNSAPAPKFVPLDGPSSRVMTYESRLRESREERRKQTAAARLRGEIPKGSIRPRTHRTSASVRAKRELKFYEYAIGRMIRPGPFRRLVREIVQDVQTGEGLRIKKAAFDVLQSEVENTAAYLFHDALQIATVGKLNEAVRDLDHSFTVEPKHLQTAVNIAIRHGNFPGKYTLFHLRTSTKAAERRCDDVKASAKSRDEAARRRRDKANAAAASDAADDGEETE